ncbi:MAG: hypothetical protein IPJ41_17270 [Phycisphaerales bacterium]|nr:hypothetical protein [Phycisphaerales bacterium]
MPTLTHPIRRFAAALCVLAGQAAAQTAAQTAAQPGAQTASQTARPQPSLDFTAQESAAFLTSLAPTNAALLYYQIFMQKDQELIESYVYFDDDPDNDAGVKLPREDAERLYAASQDYFGRLQHASQLPECDFGVQYENGWEALLPHLGDMRNSTRVLAADAWRHVQAKEGDLAVDRVETMYSMSRQVTEDRILICSLVGVAMASKAHTATRMLIDSGTLTGQGRDRLIAALERFGEEDPFHTRQCVTMEAAISIGWLAKKFPEGHAGSLLEYGADPDPALAARLAAMDGPTLIRDAERMRDYYKRGLAVWDDADAPQKLDALATAVQAGGFGDVARVFGASLGQVRKSSTRAETELADTLEALRAYKPPEPAKATDANSRR